MSMARQSFRPALMRYFEQNEGRHIYVQELVEAITNEMGPVTRDQVQGAVSNLRAAIPSYPIVTIVNGNVWKYDRSAPSATKPTQRIFEEIGQLKSGEILIQDQSGAIYRATEM